MELYVGTKVLFAKQMNKQEYCNYRNWNIPENEDPNEEGYLVEYTDGGKSNHDDHKGYISWSPKEVFEKSYRKINKDLLNVEVDKSYIVINFNDFVKLSQNISEKPHWHFKYEGYPVTQSNENEYFISIENVSIHFRKNQILGIGSHRVFLLDELTKEPLVSFFINQNK